MAADGGERWSVVRGACNEVGRTVEHEQTEGTERNFFVRRRGYLNVDTLTRACLPRDCAVFEDCQGVAMSTFEDCQVAG